MHVCIHTQVYMPVSLHIHTYLSRKTRERKMEVESNLFNSEKLSGVKIHAHINTAKCACSDKLSFPPTDGPRGNRERKRRIHGSLETEIAMRQIEILHIFVSVSLFLSLILQCLSVCLCVSMSKKGQTVINQKARIFLYFPKCPWRISTLRFSALGVISGSAQA